MSRSLVGYEDAYYAAVVTLGWEAYNFRYSGGQWYCYVVSMRFNVSDNPIFEL